MVEQAFMGSELCAVTPTGQIFLPAFIRDTLDRQSMASTILIGSHETDACLVGYEAGHATQLQADCHRRRLCEEGPKPYAHHARARRIFGLLHAVATDGDGGCMLPPILRYRARIDDAVLIVGTGAAFEMWSPQVALFGRDAAMRALAAWFLKLPKAA